MIRPAFNRAKIAGTPFPHAVIQQILSHGDADAVLGWLADGAAWTLRVENFYEQHEFSLLSTDLPPVARPLVHGEFIARVADHLVETFELRARPSLVDVSAHRLTPGQTIRVHNDFIGDEETHRVLIQLNAGWSAEQGGLLMLFASEDPASVRNVILPKHGSGFAFEISPRSFHAVSTIKSGERYTLVYTFRADP